MTVPGSRQVCLTSTAITGCSALVSRPNGWAKTGATDCRRPLIGEEGESVCFSLEYSENHSYTSLRGFLLIKTKWKKIRADYKLCSISSFFSN